MWELLTSLRKGLPDTHHVVHSVVFRLDLYSLNLETLPVVSFE